MPLKSRIPQIIGNLESAADTIAERTAEVVIEAAVEKVPVRDAELIKTIREDTAQQQNGVRVVLAGDPEKLRQDGRPVNYAAAVEYGARHVKADGKTYNTPAQPFMTPAGERGRRAMRTIAADVVKQAVK